MFLFGGSGSPPTSSDDLSLGMRIAALYLKLKGKPMSNVQKYEANILGRTYPSPANIPGRMRKQYHLRDRTLAGHRVVTFGPKNRASRWHIVYYHGGAYVRDLVGPHWSIIKSLMEATGATVTVPLYPLAPECNNRAAFSFLAEVYGEILATTSSASVVFAGDSAGGGLALGHATEIRRMGLPLPARIILFSPWLDLTLADAAARDLESNDLMLTIDALRLCGKWWAADDDVLLPRLSPLYADLKELPPIDMFQGSGDILVIDARTFATKAREAGNCVYYSEVRGAFHVFMGATFTPEAKAVFAHIASSLPRAAASPVPGALSTSPTL
ncbi:alpha/beta hydrolase domain-containing protein [Microstroma glucosiphilum]|uniref:Alpha/beta hydrolase domain-containing protein n=1 Tax=Pseudomicrostroma glucosiphilum TaxID=1684307 RepID=A0A316U6E5_9BASI|nr:alpha/beta hydrolase domain-containing protein [Pseudomicrostroma glucosiphilum]PWN20799.1 alpha/beta hydrolase domain-containing protein [Pseudomicrostroma glucosiphilum]